MSFTSPKHRTNLKANAVPSNTQHDTQRTAFEDTKHHLKPGLFFAPDELNRSHRVFQGRRSVLQDIHQARDGFQVFVPDIHVANGQRNTTPLFSVRVRSLRWSARRGAPFVACDSHYQKETQQANNGSFSQPGILLSLFLRNGQVCLTKRSPYFS